MYLGTAQSLGQPGSNMSSHTYRLHEVISKLVIVTVAAVCLGFAGCGGSKVDQELVASWRNDDEGFVVTFNADKTFVVSDGSGEDVSGTWSTSGSKLTFVIDGENQTAVYTVSGINLVLTWTFNGEPAHEFYKKVE